MEIDDLRQLLVTPAGVMVKEQNLLRSGLVRQFHGLTESRMSPVQFGPVLVVGEHGVMDQHIHITGKVHEALPPSLFDIVALTGQFVVGYVRQRDAVIVDSVSHRERRMPHAHGANTKSVLLPGAPVEVRELLLGRKLGEGDRKVDRRHLSHEELLDVSVCLVWADDTNRGVRVVQRLKEREPLDVVPVEVCEKNHGVGCTGFLHHIHAERTDAGAGVEDEAPSIPNPNLQARGITAEFDRVRAGACDRAPGSPTGSLDCRALLARVDRRSW